MNLLEHLGDPKLMEEDAAKLKLLREKEEVAELARQLEADGRAYMLNILNHVLLGKLGPDIIAIHQNKNSPYSQATLASYRSDWKSFEALAAEKGLPSLPAHPDLVAFHILMKAAEGLKALDRIKSAISYHHRVCGESDPTNDPMVAAAMRNAKRTSEAASEGN